MVYTEHAPGGGFYVASALQQLNSAVTLLESLSGTLIQTLPDLVTPLKGHTLYLRAAVQQRGQRPPKGSGTNMTAEET